MNEDRKCFLFSVDDGTSHDIFPLLLLTTPTLLCYIEDVFNRNVLFLINYILRFMRIGRNLLNIVH